MATEKAETDRVPVTLALSTISYLEKLVRQGTHGTSVPGVAKTLIEEGIRLAIKDGLLALLWQIRCVAGWRLGPEGTSATAGRVEERDDGGAYGRKAWLRRRTARLFFPDSLLEGAGAGGRGSRSCS